MKPHTVWKKSQHARAFEALKPAEQKDPKCLGCHVTGYRIVQEVSPKTEGVQCEACHGPASEYIKIHPRKDKEGARKAGMIAQPDPAACKSCHNKQSPAFKGFDFQAMWPRISHPRK